MKLKALNYLQMQTRNNKADYYDWIAKLLKKDVNGGLKDWFDLLSKSFSPDMIEKYFEGWRESDENKNSFRRDGALLNEYHHPCFLFHDIGTTYARVRYLKYDDSGGEFFYPRTLDEFITLTQLANIELYWKEN